jgi:hypothetical protein
VRVATDNIPAEEGVVLVVEILTNKSNYNTLELTSGRMAKVGKGDIVAGALGQAAPPPWRKATTATSCRRKSTSSRKPLAALSRGT